jgi:hypothetical protein
MAERFSLELAWLPSPQGLKEDQLTATALRIAFPEGIATRVHDMWSHTELDSVRVSAYPLALWFASSWWRLRWEPSTRPYNTDWLMSHDMRAAGHGFIWPPLRFESDGEIIEAFYRPDNRSKEPVRYLGRFNATIAAFEFERSIDDFIGRVLARLTDAGMAQTELHHLWNEVMEERHDPEIEARRRLEAQLGFDPDEAPDQTFTQLTALATEAGQDAISEIAPALQKRNLAASLAQTVEIARSPGIRVRILPDRGFVAQRRHDYEAAVPWERGELLARDARNYWSLNGGSLEDEELSQMLEIPCSAFDTAQAQSGTMGLAIRKNGELSLHFRGETRYSRRFECARFIADDLLAVSDRWLPATDMPTARQKMQRAFAAEFLCPIESLIRYLEGDYSDKRIEDAAVHFAVSSVLVKSQLANHGLIPRFPTRRRNLGPRRRANRSTGSPP